MATNINKFQYIKELNETYNFLVNSPHSTFYKDKYNRKGIKLKSIKNIKDFESLPYLTKDEILSVDPFDFTFVPKKDINFIAITSGTTKQDKPLTLLFNLRSRPAYFRERQLFLDLKIKTNLILFSSINATTHAQLDYGATENGIINIIGDLTNLPLTAKIAKRLNIESIETTPSILYLFIPYLKKEYDLNKIKLIYIGGEYCSEAKYKYLKGIFKNAKIQFTFGSMETNGIGKRCEYISKLAPRFFHPWENFYVEILGQDDNGELILTGIEQGKYLFLLRYRTGNHVRLTFHDCPCGNKQLLEVFGKIGHDTLSVHGTFIYSSYIHKILSSNSNLLNNTDFRLHVYEVIKKDKIMIKLVLQLIPKKNINNQNIAKEEIKKNIETNLFLTAKNTMADLVNKKIFMPLEIEFVENFPFSQKQTSIISHII